MIVPDSPEKTPPVRCYHRTTQQFDSYYTHWPLTAELLRTQPPEFYVIGDEEVKARKRKSGERYDGPPERNAWLATHLQCNETARSCLLALVPPHSLTCRIGALTAHLEPADCATYDCITTLIADFEHDFNATVQPLTPPPQPRQLLRASLTASPALRLRSISSSNENSNSSTAASGPIYATRYERPKRACKKERRARTLVLFVAALPLDEDECERASTCEITSLPALALDDQRPIIVPVDGCAYESKNNFAIPLLRARLGVGRVLFISVFVDIDCLLVGTLKHYATLARAPATRLRDVLVLSRPIDYDSAAYLFIDYLFTCIRAHRIGVTRSDQQDDADDATHCAVDTLSAQLATLATALYSNSYAAKRVRHVRDDGPPVPPPALEETMLLPP